MDTLEAYLVRGEYLRTIREAEELLLDEELPLSQKAWAYRILGGARARSGDPYGALKVLEMAQSLSLKVQDWDCLGAARVDLGIAWLMIGDYGSSIESFQSYLLDHNRYSKAKSFQGVAHFNLALAYRRARRYQASVEHYTQALSWFTERGYTLQAGQTHQNLAWAYCLNGHYIGAGLQLAIADTYLDVCGQSFQAEQLVCRSLYFLGLGQLGTSMLMVEEVLRPSRTAVTDTHRGHAAWIAGCVALRARHLEMAAFFADMATQFALDAKEPAIMSQVSLLRAEIAKRKSEEEAAG